MDERGSEVSTRSSYEAASSSLWECPYPTVSCVPSTFGMVVQILCIVSSDYLNIFLHFLFQQELELEDREVKM